MTIQKIIVIRRDNIGDLVCTTPLFRVLREKFPEARIDALVNSYNRPVLDGNPDIDHVFAYTKAKHRESGETLVGAYWRRLTMIRELRGVGYDLAILANDGDVVRALKFARWIRPARVAAYLPRGHNAFAGIDLPVRMDETPRHAVAYALRLLEPLGLSAVPPKLRLQASPEALARARQAVGEAFPAPGKPLVVGIHISARKVPQRWPVERFAELMARIHAQHGNRFMVFWSPGDEANPRHPGDDRKAADLLSKTAGLPVLPYPTNRLEDLIGGLALCDIVVCSDGGAMHLAAGLGKPIVCFFGNSDAVRWHPWGVPHVVLQQPSRHVDDISVEDAFSAFSRLCDSPSAPPPN